MNNFSNFDPNGNPPRQAPNAAQAQQMNGINGPTHWPNVGAQADMNVLWEYIQNLSQMHEGIRAQTQHVLNGVQQIQARAAQEDGSSAGVQLNGVDSGMAPYGTTDCGLLMDVQLRQARAHLLRRSHVCRMNSHQPIARSMT
jgi:hypothetical protein